ncbi:MAG: GH32 C-terminal domain-containing protein, partial [Cetobacterium sp.]
KDSKVLTLPVEELKHFRKEKIAEFSEISKAKNCYDIELRLKSLDNFSMTLFKSEKDGLKLNYFKERGSFVLDREGVINGFEPLSTFGILRECKISENKEMNLRVIVDRCVAEIYINDGEKVMSAVVNPRDSQIEIEVSGDILSKEIYILKK